MGDEIVVITTILFALSLITEKTTQFVRDYTSRANYFIILIVIVIEIGVSITFWTNLTPFVKFLLLLFLGINFIILVKDFLKINIGGPIYFSHLRWYTLTRLVIIITLLVILFFVGVFSGLFFGLQFLCILAFISLGIIRIKLPLYKTKYVNTSTFLTIPYVEHKDNYRGYHKKNAPEINLLAFVIGFFYSSFFNLNIFELPLDIDQFNNVQSIFADFEDIFKNEPASSQNVLAFISYIFVGFFLSFGSKFFHDLLDLVYSVKSTRQALGDEKLYRQQSASSVLSFLENYQIRHHLSEKRNTLHSIEDVVGTGIVQERIDGRYFEHIMVATKTPDLDISEHFKIMNNGGEPIEIPYIIRHVDGPAELLSLPKLNWNEVIYNQGNNSQIGSFSVIVGKSDNEKFLLTCYHVVKHPSHDFHNFAMHNINKSIGQSTSIIGKISDGIIDYKIDAALIELNDNLDLSDFQKNPIAANHIAYDFDVGLNIYLFGQKSKERMYGQVTTVREAYEINYRGYRPVNADGNFTHELSYLFAINDIGISSMSVSGDSGGCVYQASNGWPLGMIVAKENRKNGDTIVIPLANILRRFPEIKFVYPLKL